MAIGGVSSYFNYPSYSSAGLTNDYDTWVENAASRTEALEKELGIDSSTSSASGTKGTSGTSSTSGTKGTSSASSTSNSKGTSSTSSTSSSASSSATNTSTFLLSYKQKLEDLESAASKLQSGNSKNVFSQYESALEKLQRASTEEGRKTAQAAVDKAKENIVSAVKDFADKYNSAVSFLGSNSNRSTAVSNQLASLQRALKTEGAMATVGLGVDSTGKLTVDEDKLNEALDSNVGFVKSVVGGQFGIAQNAGMKATAILDNASVDSIAGNTNGSSKSKSLEEYYSSLENFAYFAKAGAYNLSNYYAVGMLLNTYA